MGAVTHVVQVTNPYWVNAMKLLHIDSSILGADSVTRRVGAAAVARFSEQIPDLDVTYRDLAAEAPDHVTLTNLPGAAPDADETALEEFLAADIVVIGAPMYNFTVPSVLKAWIDRILVAGRTFRYGASGPEGLAGAKRVVIAVSRGNFYGPGAPAAPAEHVETYLRSVFGFIGVAEVAFLIAEGVKASPEQRERALDAALTEAGRLAA